MIYLTPQMLATKNGCSVYTIRRIMREMRESGNYPVAIRRCGGVTVSEEAFEHYVCRREYGRKNAKEEA